MEKVVRYLIFVSIFIIVSGNATDTRIREGKFGFFNSATSMISSLARDFVSRSGTSSQVLSLNLTNLFILLVLKAVVFGAGAFGYGHTGHYGRSAEPSLNEASPANLNFSEYLSETELLMMLSFLRADTTRDYGCLQRITCQDPHRAEEYAFTGKLFLKGYEYLAGPLNNSNYENALSHVDEAIGSGLSGQNCVDKYRCEVS
ncbi:hypothetical protein RUM44_013805 [Polyplax serrata]|uniref:Uncharacterized protein n=1 Tax=Polyplax serrata TaxID=468196 RepID=A0ABR1BFH3_POLSC